MLQKFLRGLQEADYLLSRLASLPFPKRYTRQGACGRTGVCCRNIGVVAPGWVFQRKLFKGIVQWWYEYVNEFYIKQVLPDEYVFVFGCPYLKDNQCSRYASRPPICRHYQNGGFFVKPATFPTCGFRFVARSPSALASRAPHH